MAPRNVVSFLAGSVRLLQKRVDMLESMRPFSFNPEAPEFTPKTLLRLESLVPPPGIFDLQPADVHLAALVNELMKDDNVSASDAIEPKLLDGAIQRAEAVLRASDAIEPKLLDDAIQRDEAVLRVSDAIEPKLLDDVIQRAEALRVSDAIEPELLDDAIQRAEAVVRDWKFPAENVAEPEISFEYWKFSEVTCVDFIQRSKNLSNNFILRSKNLSVEVSDVPSPDNCYSFKRDLSDDHAALMKLTYAEIKSMSAVMSLPTHGKKGALSKKDMVFRLRQPYDG